MKKISFALIAAFCLAFFFTQCKKENQQVATSSEFSSPSLISDRTSTPNTNVKQIYKIDEKSQIFNIVKQSADFKAYNTSMGQLDLNNMKYFTFKNSNTTAISINIITNNAEVTKSFYAYIENGVLHNSFVSEINVSQETRDLIAKNPNSFQSANQVNKSVSMLTVGGDLIGSVKVKDSQVSFSAPGSVKRTATIACVTNCVLEAIQACSNDLPCTIALIVDPEAVILGFGIGCGIKCL